MSDTTVPATTATATTAPTIELQSVTKTYPASRGQGEPVTALDSVSLTAAQGEFVAIVGPSGSGKSSLFNIVSGLDSPTSGRLLLDGAEAAKPLGASAYMPQRDALMPWRRVDANVSLGLEIAGVSRREARSRARSLLEQFHLDRFAEAYPDQLSGGMRSRVALLRTIATEQRITLLDEPFAALDSITREEVQDWLLEALGGSERSTVLVTHDVSEAVYLADVVYVLSSRPGRIVGRVETGLPRPRTREAQERPEFIATVAEIRRLLHRHTPTAVGDPARQAP